MCTPTHRTSSTHKATDSLIISGYSPLRGLFVPNLVDTSVYTVSALLGARHSGCHHWAAGAAVAYTGLRFGLDSIY